MRKWLLVFLIMTCMQHAAYASVYMHKDAHGNITYTDVPGNNSQAVTLPDENTATQTSPNTQSTQTMPATPQVIAPSVPPGLPQAPGGVPAPQQTMPVITPGQPITSINNPAVPPGAPTAPVEYKVFKIESPKDQETIQNQTSITVDIQLDPELQQGDRIQILVDGKLWGAAYIKTKIEVEGVERGQHTLSAVLINREQRIIKQSNTITIFVHRASTNSPGLQNNPNVPRSPSVTRSVL